jgi:GAF domain-containing protein
MDAGGAASRDLETLAEAFAELVETTMGEFDVQELLQVLVDRCVEVLGVSASGLMLAGADGLNVMVASNQQAKLLELFQVQHDEGPCLDCYHSGEVITAELNGGLARWPRFERACEAAGFSTVIAVPLRVDGRVFGGLNLFGTADQPAPNPTTAKVAQAMAKVAVVAIEHDRIARERATLIAQLETALESRVVIEQAKGILATHLDIGLDKAFALLRSRARSSRRLLKDIAAEVIESGGQNYSTNGDPGA